MDQDSCDDRPAKSGRGEKSEARGGGYLVQGQPRRPSEDGSVEVSEGQHRVRVGRGGDNEQKSAPTSRG